VLGTALVSTLAVLLLTAPADDHEVVLRGEAACLDAAGAVIATGADCPDDPAGGWGLRTPDGTLHRFASDDPRTEMLSDTRVSAHELQVTAWRSADGTHAIVHLRTVIDGRLHDPHYWCGVCSIRSQKPGLCWCCRAPFEFRDPEIPGDPGKPAPRPEG